MDPEKSRRPEKGALEIIEEATHLLRLAPAGILFQYYLGALPFVLGFLFFWVDMSCSGSAGPHLVQASLGVAVLFLWMKCWQAVFTSNLRSFLEDAPPSPWSIGRVLRLVCIQSIATPWMMVILPLALVITLPFGWCFAFFHNMGIFGDGAQEFKITVQRARQQCTLWPAQNHLMILIFILLAIFIYLNICMTGFLIPIMLKTFMGIETLFSRSNDFFLSTTFLLSMACITYLCINPLIRAAYVLRCFYGESLSSGRDLLSEWRRLHRLAGQLLLIMAITFTLIVPCQSKAASGTSGRPQPQTAATGIPADKLDRAISEVIGGVEYSWRFPHEKLEEPKNSGFLGQVLDTVGGWLKTAWSWVETALEWFREWLKKLIPEGPKTSNSLNLPGDVRLWLVILLLAALPITVWLLRNMIGRRKAAAECAGEEGLSSFPEADLRDENTSADQLPEARWLALAKSLLESGDLRLALRALYFAALAQLADRNLLTISRSKSNRDYEREIKRRAHAFPGLAGAFSENVTILERVWYGIHAAELETVQQFLSNNERITANDQGR